MPDGPVCAACHAAAVRTRGNCAACGDERLLPGIDGEGRRLCPPCAGIEQDYTCGRCGTEWNLVNGLCEWCQLADLLDDLLDGDVDLHALRARLLEAARPDHLNHLALRNPRPRAAARSRHRHGPPHPRGPRRLPDPPGG
jgi:hypothetical protein